MYLEENVTKETILEDTTHHNETLFKSHEDEEAGSKGYVVGKGFNSLIRGDNKCIEYRFLINTTT